MSEGNGHDAVRVGVVGTGAGSQLVHLPVLAERGDVELLAVADADTPKARAIGERFDVERIVDVDALCNDADVEAVFICTPNHLHEEQAVAALQAGKHVLVERPMALTAAGAKRVLAAAKEANRTVVVGMSHRFRPDVSALRSFVAGGELGRVYAARVAWMNRRVQVRRTTWRQRPEEAGGGAFMDLGVQSLDMALWLLGMPRITRVKAVLAFDEGEVEDAATVLAETDDGVALSLEVSWSYTHHDDQHYARVLGLEGSGSLPPLEVFKQLGGRPMEVTPRQPRAADSKGYLNAYRREIDHFLRAVRGEADAPPPADQVHLMEVVEAIYTSGRERLEVSL